MKCNRLLCVWRKRTEREKGEAREERKNTRESEIFTVGSFGERVKRKRGKRSLIPQEHEEIY